MPFTEVTKTDAVPVGTMKHFDARDTELLIANVNGTFYAMGDRCPHMNARLSMGVLQNNVVICPLHYSRFDIATGKKISGPVYPQLEGMDKLPPAIGTYMARTMELIAPVRTYDMKTYPVKIEGKSVLVDLP